MRIIVLIPCYNEAENIITVINNLKSTKANADYVIINDSSTDNIVDLCIEKKFTFISLPVNLGIGGCMQTGYKYALDKGYDIAVQHDGDGQHDPSYIDEIVASIISNEADIVIGSRFLTNEGFQSSTTRRIGIRFISFLINLFTGVKVKDVTSGYRAVNKDFIKVFANHYSQDYPEAEAIMEAAMLNARIIEKPVIMNKRLAGKSSIGFWGSVYYMVKVSLGIILYRTIFNKRRYQL